MSPDAPRRPWLRRMGLREMGTLWVLVAFAAGAGSAALWVGSRAAWDLYLGRAQMAGVSLHESLMRGTTPPEGMTLTPVPLDQQAQAEKGEFGRLPDVPVPAQITRASIRDGTAEDFGSPVLRLAIVSDGLRYEVAELAGGARTGPEKLGRVTRLMATYCSNPVLFASAGDGPWQRVEAPGIWSCAAQPGDYRLGGLLLALVVLAVLWTRVAEVTSRFRGFAVALDRRRIAGGPERYPAEGPAELAQLVDAVNAHLEAERALLARRAEILSGVSHDLGTPATRLRLRTRLIEDDALRAKFDHDIDRMTGMIESVLTYTRSEMSAEAPRELSLTSLVEAMVADYEDMGRPVTLRPPEPGPSAPRGTLFAARLDRPALPAPEEGPVLVTARPVALGRAIGNLIDNALKYGRRAEVWIEAGAERAAILVKDAGQGMAAEEMEALVRPFRRGGNAVASEGFGLGLTIVQAVAEQHGGRLSYARGSGGMIARLEITRR